MIVEDDENVRQAYAWCLRVEGWVVEEAARGEEALAAVARFEPDVVVLDLRLPGLDGLQVAHRLKSSGSTRHIPLVACTGLDREEAMSLARTVGCDEVLLKPCAPESLVLFLESVVARSQRAEE